MNKEKQTYVAPKLDVLVVEMEQGIAAGSGGKGNGNGKGWGHHKDDPDFPGRGGNGHRNSFDSFDYE